MATESTIGTATYEVIVKKLGQRYTATVLGFPSCSAEAESRDEAIRLAREALASFLSDAESVRIKVESPTTRSLLEFAGMWAEDDTFQEFVDSMHAHRQAVDADETS